jgi:two-component system, sensor histidine kinase YesM
MKLKNIYYNFVRNYRFIRKINIAIIVLIVFPMLITSWIFYQRVARVNEDYISESYMNLGERYVDSVDFNIRTFQFYVNNVAKNNRIINILENHELYTNENILILQDLMKNELNNIIPINMQQSVIKFSVYSKNNQFPIDGNVMGNTSNDDDILNQVAWDKGSFFSTSAGMKRDTLSLIEPILSIKSITKAETIGFVRIDLLCSLLFDLGDIYSKQMANFYIIREDGKIVFKNGGNFDSVLSEMVAGMNANQSDTVGPSTLTAASKSFLTINHLRYVVVKKSINTVNATCILVFPYSKIDQKIRESGSFFLYVLGLFALMFFLMTWLLNVVFSQRMNQLILKMQKAQSGQIQKFEIIKGTDEIAVLDLQFNIMMKQLNQLIDENFVQALLVKDTQLIALQAQINPHFLFNTLQAIDSIAVTNGVMEISKICQKLGRMFRYNININLHETAMLKDEIENVSNYIYIMKLRFRNQFDIFYDVPDELMNHRILRFILQPIVENSLNHGFKSKDKMGAIEVSAEIRNEKIMLTVADDGDGIDDATLSSIQDELLMDEIHIQSKSKPSDNIGLLNVHLRIRLTYGKDYGLQVFSQLDVGTEVVMWLPLFDENARRE